MTPIPEASVEPAVLGQWAFRDNAAFVLTISNVNFDALIANSKMLALVAHVVHRAASAECSEPGAGPVSVEIMGGPFAAHCVVTLHCALRDARFAADRDGRPPAALGAAVSAALGKCSELQSAAVGPIGVSHVSAFVAAALAGFQGSWKKDGEDGDELYEVRGDLLRFPSRGTARIRAEGPRCFSIAHPSGAVLYAQLRSHGRQLRWADGPVWRRAGMRGGLAAAGDALRQTALHAEAALEGTLYAVRAERQKLHADRRRLESAQEAVVASRVKLRGKLDSLREELAEVSRLREELAGAAAGGGRGARRGCEACWLCPSSEVGDARADAAAEDAVLISGPDGYSPARLEGAWSPPGAGRHCGATPGQGSAAAAPRAAGRSRAARGGA